MKLSFSLRTGLAVFLCLGSLHPLVAEEKPISIAWFLKLSDAGEDYYEQIEAATFSSELQTADPTLGPLVREYVRGKDFKIAFLSAMEASLKATPEYRRDHSPKGVRQDLMVARFPAAQAYLAKPTPEMIAAVTKVQIRALVADAKNGFSRLSLPVSNHTDELAVPLFDSPLGFLSVKQSSAGKILECSPQNVASSAAKTSWFDQLKPILISALTPLGGTPKEDSIGSQRDEEYMREVSFELRDGSKVDMQLVSLKGQTKAGFSITAPQAAGQ